MVTERGRRRLALGIGALLFALGCASPVVAPVEPPSGGLFAMYKAPLETNFEGTPVGSKVGIAQLHFFREPFSGYRVPILTVADANLDQAAANGFIETVYYADYEVLNVLGIYTQVTIRVSGD